MAFPSQQKPLSPETSVAVNENRVSGVQQAGVPDHGTLFTP